MLRGIELTGYLANQNEMQFDQILLQSAPCGTPYINWTPSQIMEELCRLTKTIPELQAAISLMMLNKNLLFITIGSLTTIDFVWKTQARFHSFTFFCQGTLSHILRCKD